MYNPFDEDFWQWSALVVLLLVSVSTCFLSISNYRQSKELHQMKGKVDLISETYIKVFSKMHERLMDAMDKD